MEPEQRLRDFRVLVCGGRHFGESEEERKGGILLLDRLLAPVYPGDLDGRAGTWLPRPDLVIVEGGADGADRLAYDWAVVNGCRVEEYRAEWDTHGRAAGPIRNQKMLDTGIDMVIAFPGGSGTADMVRRAKQARIPVLEAF